MPESPHLNPRKRPRSEHNACELYPSSFTPSPPLKKHKVSHSTKNSHYHPPPKFWKNLSVIWLTRSALEELDRQNRLSASSPRPDSPLLQPISADSKSHCSLTQSAPEILLQCDIETLTDIKRFASHGGPDLTDLRGVSTIRVLIQAKLTLLFTVLTIRKFSDGSHGLQTASREKARLGIPRKVIRPSNLQDNIRAIRS